MTELLYAEGQGENGEFDPEEASHVQVAKLVAETLLKHYPNHMWGVSVQGGAVVVRNIMISAEVERVTGEAGAGYLLPMKKLGSPKEIVRAAVMGAGEFLEQFGLARGPWNGEVPVVPVALVLEAKRRNASREAFQ